MIRIVVLQCGWVVIERYQEEGEMVKLTDAADIRRWGTTKGLGELVNGPTKNTVLDKTGIIEAHKLAVVMTINVSEDDWKDRL